MDRKELDYFACAQNFFKSDLNRKLEIYHLFSERQDLIFVYDLFLEKTLEKSAYAFCNFSFLMYCVYYTYSSLALDLVFGNDASIEKIENSRKYLNSEILGVAKKSFDDVALQNYYARDFKTELFGIDLIPDFLNETIFDVDKVADFYDFLPRQFDF
ncbi:hypothetical protein [Comamonas sp.]|uniref:hypothetical protein n=1 Tax=Comamonas sp. TaxID=34028 RepID=UPI0028A8704A|nr:hypothetical protein [Comamonas sp.]